MNYRFLCIFLFSIQYCFSQQKNIQEIDSLSELSYEILINSFYETSKLSAQEIFTESILRKAKIEKDTPRIKTAYYFYTDIYHGKSDDLELNYLDSLIHISSLKPDFHFPSGIYFNKGIFLLNKGNFKLATDAFVKSNQYALKYKNTLITFESEYYIAFLKSRIGKHKEAIKIHKKNSILAENNIDSIGKLNYVYSIFALAFTHKNLKNLDSASYYNDLGLKLSDEFRIKSIKPYFIMNEGVVSYLRNEYDIATFNIEKAKSYFENKNDLPNLSEAYFYLGKIANDQKQQQKAVKYFKKTDTIFSQIKFMYPELRENYRLLSNYYKKNKNIEKQLFYSTKIIGMDSILNSNYVYINDYLKNEYDIPKIVSAKEDLIFSLKKTNKSKTTYIYASIIILLLIIIFFYRRHQIFKKRFEKLLLDTKETLKTSNIEIDQTKKKSLSFDVPQELAENILKGLDDFEKRNGFLDANIKLVLLAKLLKTNTNYLSKTINHYKEKNINVYLNDLRVDYAIRRLKEDSKFRNYTIKAIAKEIGFKSSETFSKTFYKKTGIYPSFFIKQIEKKI